MGSCTFCLASPRLSKSFLIAWTHSPKPVFKSTPPPRSELKHLPLSALQDTGSTMKGPLAIAVLYCGPFSNDFVCVILFTNNNVMVLEGGWGLSLLGLCYPLVSSIAVGVAGLSKTLEASGLRAHTLSAPALRIKNKVLQGMAKAFWLLHFTTTFHYTFWTCGRHC